MTLETLESGSLMAVLKRCRHDDLKQIADAINKALDVFITLDKRYIEHKDDLGRIPEVIGEYLCRAGGHSVRNWFRGGGPEYGAVVADVCAAFGLKKLTGGVVAMEEALLKELARRALAKMSEKDKEDLLQKMREAAGRPVGFETILQTGGSLLSTLLPLLLSTIARQATADGAIAVMEVVGGRAAAGFLGPVGIAIGILTAAHSFAGPSLRGTIPAVANVALIRQRLMWAAA